MGRIKKKKQTNKQNVQNRLPQNKNKLWGQVLKAWGKMSWDVEYFEELVVSMPSSIRVMVSSKSALMILTLTSHVTDVAVKYKDVDGDVYIL